MLGESVTTGRQDPWHRRTNASARCRRRGGRWKGSGRQKFAVLDADGALDEDLGFDMRAVAAVG